MAWLYGPTAAGAPVVWIASRVMGRSSAAGASGLQADERGGDGRRGHERRTVPGGRRVTRRPRRADDRRGGLRRIGRAKDRPPTGSGRTRTARSGRWSSRVRARRNGTSSGSTSATAGRRSLAAAMTPARAARSAADRPDTELGREVDRRRPDGPVARAADRGEGREHVRRGDGHGRASRAGSRARRAGRSSGVTRSPRPSTRAGRARREERHVGAEAGGDRQAGVVVELGAPQFERGRRASRRRRTTRHRGRPRPGSASRVGPRPPARDPGRRTSHRRRPGASRRSRAGPGCPDRRRTAPPATWSESAAAVGRRQAEPVREGERHEHRVEVVEPVGPAADDREGQVELGRRDPDDRRQRRWPVTAGRGPGRGGPRRSGRSPRAGPATPPPRGSAAAGQDRCRPSRAPR